MDRGEDKRDLRSSTILWTLKTVRELDRMKRFSALATIAYGSMIFACEPVDYLRYVGMDVGHSFVQTFVMAPESDDKKVHHQAQQVNVYSGYRIGKYAAFEMGAFKVYSLNSSANHRDGMARSQGFHMGFVFSLPLTDSLNFIPGLGVSHVFVHSHKPGAFDVKENGPTPRLMMGAEYKVNNEWRIRVSAIYNRLNGFYSGPVSMSGNVNVGVGLNYSFWPK